MRNFIAFILFTLALPALADSPNYKDKLTRKIYSYSCEAKFLEGESVTPNSISCEDGMHLGFYTANYEYYLYADDSSNNFYLRATDSYYMNGHKVCGLVLPKYDCTKSELHPKFALSPVRNEEFPIAVSLQPNPNSGGFVMGYAAALHSDATCAKGLVKIRPFLAFPASIIAPLPSNFINSYGRLNSIVIGTEAQKPQAFEVNHIPATSTCEDGTCEMPKGERQVAQSISYMAASPVVCAIEL